jgi:hypothetical protein
MILAVELQDVFWIFNGLIAPVPPFAYQLAFFMSINYFLISKESRINM